MQREQIHAAALARGCTPQALEAITAKVEAHFAGRTPAPGELDAYIVTAIPVWDRLGMTQETFDAMPAAWRLEQGRSPVPPLQKYRPQPQSDAAVAAFAGMSVEAFNKLPPNQRAAKARELEAQQGKA